MQYKRNLQLIAILCVLSNSCMQDEESKQTTHNNISQPKSDKKALVNEFITINDIHSDTLDEIQQQKDSTIQEPLKTKQKVQITKTKKKLSTSNKAKKVVIQKVQDEVTTNSSAIVTSSTLDQAGVKTSKPWSLANSLSLATSVKETDAPSDFLTSSFSSAFTYKLNETYSAQAVLAASKQLQDEYKQSIDAAFVGVNFKLFSYRDTLKAAGKVRTYLPVNSDQREATSFRGRLYTNFGLSYNLADIGFQSVTLGTSLTLAKNFHEFEYSNSNAFNTSHYSTFALSLGVDVTDKFYVAFSGTATTKWDYDNDLTGPSTYSLGQELGYLFGKGWSLALAHEIGGSAYGYNGSELEIDIFDKDNSVVSTSIQFVY